MAPHLLVATGMLVVLPASAADPVACTTPETTWKQRQVNCALPAGMTAQPMRFVARFGGGHDDTEVSLAVKLDGKPLNCAPGSNAGQVGGDGEVVLDCRFELAAAPSARQLAVTVNYFHGEWLGTTLEPGGSAP